MIYLLELTYIFGVIPAIGYAYGYLGYEYYTYWKSWKVGFFFSIIAIVFNELWRFI